MTRIRPLVLVAALLVSACGSTKEDRALSGSGIGAAGGAIIGAITGLTVLEGAAIGALGGALTGVFTDEGQLDLGAPVWRRGSGSRQAANAGDGAAPAGARAPARAAARSPVVERVQAALRDRGYDPGPVDGRMGPRTQAAIRRYQQDHELLTDGRASVELAEHIQGKGAGAGGVAVAADGPYQ